MKSSTSKLLSLREAFQETIILTHTDTHTHTHTHTHTALFIWHHNDKLTGVMTVHVDDFLCAETDLSKYHIET